jgi:hypothetical protein
MKELAIRAVEAARAVCRDAAWLNWAELWERDEEFMPRGLAVTAQPKAARYAAQAVLTLTAWRKEDKADAKVIYARLLKSISEDAVEAAAEMQEYGNDR